tara:strand:- start:1404 stop:2057 length:654 start_codon:yes stop_codon:yes gene_type:complete
MSSITAVVPVRKGSQRVPNKNTKSFAGSSLLEIKIESLKSLGDLLDDIVVSSDCADMLAIAKDLGVKTHVRDSYFASSEVNNSQFFRNLAESISGDNLMYSPVTCPLISKETYSKCIDSFRRIGKPVATVREIKHHMWQSGKPLNYSIENSPNSQDLPDIVYLTYGVCLISREDMIRNSNVVTLESTFIKLNELESIDIDTPLDFEVAEYLYKSKNT